MIITGPYQGWQKNLGFLQEIFTIFIGYLGFNSGHKITTHKPRFSHVNATNRSSYFNIISIKLVTQVEKETKKLIF